MRVASASIVIHRLTFNHLPMTTLALKSFRRSLDKLQCRALAWLLKEPLLHSKHMKRSEKRG